VQHIAGGRPAKAAGVCVIEGLTSHLNRRWRKPISGVRLWPYGSSLPRSCRYELGHESACGAENGAGSDSCGRRKYSLTVGRKREENLFCVILYKRNTGAAGLAYEGGKESGKRAQRIKQKARRGQA